MADSLDAFIARRAKTNPAFPAMVDLASEWAAAERKRARERKREVPLTRRIRQRLVAPADREAERLELRDEVVEALVWLGWHTSGHELQVVVMHDLGDWTFEALGKWLGVSKQRVHQIHRAALRRLRERLEGRL